LTATPTAAPRVSTSASLPTTSTTATSRRGSGLTGLIGYEIDALVADGDTVAAAWTGTLPSGAEVKGLSLYRVAGDLLRSTRHALIGDRPV
jgi:hypothetical protein